MLRVLADAGKAFGAMGVAGGDGPRATALGAAWLACRVAYIAAYVGDIPTLRSLLWFGAIGATAGLFALPVL